ncbi:MAG: DeoR/GlpR transcriptional regulator [Lachnospiraceae bacterium]|nr:DeoR/GlpR transcriptional regulator [Lachnospiraceae bacterium]
MRQEERRDYILRQLNEKSSVTVSELSETFQLSEVSVRKLLVSMEQDGVLKRTWGGAVSAYGSLREFSHKEKEIRHKAEKNAIARAAYAQIGNGEAVFLDSGTTTIQLARLIVGGPKRDIMVCTNSIHIAMELAKAGDIQTIVTGGELRPNIYSCVGSFTEYAIGRMYFDKGFVTGNHFTLEHGFSAPILAEAEVKRRVLEASKEKFILMDSSKYGDDSLVAIAPANGIDVLITDWRAPGDLIDGFTQKGVKVIAAPGQ